jgi:hypothetical protein
MIRLPQICLNFLDFPHRLGGKEILWVKRNFGDCKRIFEQAVVEALKTTTITSIKSWQSGNKTTKASADTKNIISCTQCLIINIFMSAVEMFHIY